MVLVIAMERSDRSNLLASRSPHYVRDDNLYYARNDKKTRWPRRLKRLLAMTSCLYTCHEPLVTRETCRKHGMAIYLPVLHLHAVLVIANSERVKQSICKSLVTRDGVKQYVHD